MNNTEFDFTLRNHGNLFILTPLSEAGREWADNFLPEDALKWGGGTVIEPRYVEDIVDGILGDGLAINSKEAA